MSAMAFSIRHRCRAFATLTAAVLLSLIAACSEPVQCGAGTMLAGHICVVVEAGADGTDAVVADSGTDSTASDAAVDPCTPSAGAMRVDRACAANGALIECATHTSHSCDPEQCAAWLDPATHTLEAWCLYPSESRVCDPATDVDHCEGGTALHCQSSGQADAGVSVAPPGFWVSTDCIAVLGAGATCSPGDGGGVHCGSPTAVPCDPSTFTTTCAGTCANVAGSWYVRPFQCPAGERCIQNGLTDASCVPDSALPVSGGGGSTTLVLRACEGADTVRVEQFGYTWSEACEAVSMPGPDQCFAAPDGTAHCIPSSAMGCDPAAATPATCTSETTSQGCSGAYYVATSRCNNLDGTPSACDPGTGACLSFVCSTPGQPARCLDDHRSVTCSVSGAWLVSSCVGCHAADGGAGVVCGG